MTIRVNVQLGDIAGKVKKATEFSQFALDQQVMKDSNYYAPQDTGNLQRSVLTNSLVGKGEIVWETPYAKRLYYNPQFNFSKDRNPNARGLWFEHAKAIHGNQWTAVAQRGVKEYLDNH